MPRTIADQYVLAVITNRNEPPYYLADDRESLEELERTAGDGVLAHACEGCGGDIFRVNADALDVLCVGCNTRYPIGSEAVDRTVFPF